MNPWWRQLQSLWLLMLITSLQPLLAADFEEANRLYEKDEFSASALQYRELIRSGQESAAVWFNLGNALFKSGEAGRGIYSYRRAVRLAPRDPDVRANLMFARKEVAGAFAPETSSWAGFFRYLSQAEWIWFTAIVASVCFAMLAWREANRKARGSLVWTIRLTAFAVLLVGSLAAVAHTQWDESDEGVVVVEKVSARYGPLVDSKSFFQLKDGEEVEITGYKGDWIQVMNTSGQSGWVQSTEIQPMMDELADLRAGEHVSRTD